MICNFIIILLGLATVQGFTNPLTDTPGISSKIDPFRKGGFLDKLDPRSKGGVLDFLARIGQDGTLNLLDLAENITGNGKYADIKDVKKNVSELITSEGYPLEEHTVQTSDGYLLSVQRIPHGRNSSTNRNNNKEVVLLVHGDIGDAKTWFLNPPGQSLGYILPDAGYDVWCMNDRGNDYSQKNIYYSTKDYRFWNYSFNEMGIYDLPSTIDYILEETGKDSLYVIGYSRGNTLGFILLSERPEYNDKVKLLIALAPIAFVGHLKNIFVPPIPFAEEIALSVNLVTYGEFVPHNETTKIIIAKFCASNVAICEGIFYSIAGIDREQLNKTRLYFYASQYISSTSTKDLVHYAQLYRSKKFRKYDYGLLENIKHYRRVVPPDYPLSKITAPVYLFSSLNDLIAAPKDVKILQRKLKSLVKNNIVPDKYNHFDFIWAKNAPELIYNPILEMLPQF